MTRLCNGLAGMGWGITMFGYHGRTICDQTGELEIPCPFQPPGF